MIRLIGNRGIIIHLKFYKKDYLCFIIKDIINDKIT